MTAPVTDDEIFLSPELRVLPRRQVQVHAASPRLDRVLKHLLSFRWAPGSASPGQLPDLLRVLEGELPGQRRLQVGLKELHLPARSQEKVHVDLVAGFFVPGHVGSIGRRGGEEIHRDFVAVMTRNGAIFSGSGRAATTVRLHSGYRIGSHGPLRSDTIAYSSTRSIPRKLLSFLTLVACFVRFRERFFSNPTLSASAISY